MNCPLNRCLSILGLLSLVGGCSSREEAALHAVSKAGYEFSIREFLRAASEGKREVVRQFLKAGMAVNARDDERDTALIAAAAAGQFDVVSDLLDRGARLNHAGNLGRTAVLRASASGHRDVVELLMLFGADLTTPDEKGWTPLTVAAYEGRVPVVRLLIPDSVKQLDQAILACAMGGNAETIAILAQTGAGLEHRNSAGLTPLMLAAQAGNLEAVKALIELGANRAALDRKGRSAAELASQSGFSAVSELIGQMPTVQVEEPSEAEEGDLPSPYFGGYGTTVVVLPQKRLIPAAGLGSKVGQRLPTVLDGPSVVATEP